MSIDAAFIRRLLDFTDPIGVLTITSGFAPEQAADPQPTAPIALRNQVRALQHDLEASGRHDVARHLEKRIAEFGEHFDGVTDQRAHGRGRALFVALSTGERRHVNVQVPFEERVVLRDRAYLRPLVAAIDEGRPAGIVVTSAEDVRLLEWSLGETVELARLDFRLTDAQLADSHGGPVAANPQRGQTSTSHREAFEDRIADNRHRFLKQAVEVLAGLVRDRRWDRLVLSGSERVRDELVGLLPAGLTDELVKADASWEGATPAVIGQRAWPLLRSVHMARERGLVATVVEKALGGNAGALGARAVCEAANQGRVAHLLFNDDRTLSGVLAEDGSVHPEVRGTAALSGMAMRDEPYLVERLVERVLTMGGRVTRVDDESAVATLAEHGGLGALLRW